MQSIPLDCTHFVSCNLRLGSIVHNLAIILDLAWRHHTTGSLSLDIGSQNCLILKVFAILFCPKKLSKLGMGFGIFQFGIQYLPLCSLCSHGLQSVNRLAGLQELASIYQYIDEISIMRKVEPIYHDYQPPASSAVRSQYGGQPINQLRASRCSILIVFAYMYFCVRVYMYLCIFASLVFECILSKEWAYSWIE